MRKCLSNVVYYRVQISMNYSLKTNLDVILFYYSTLLGKHCVSVEAWPLNCPFFALRVIGTRIRSNGATIIGMGEWK